MNRKDRILQHINKSGVGLEIGPSHAPIAPKSEGYNVHVVDHLDKESLIEKYRPHGCAIENIEEVDFIWHGETYAELTGRTHYYDWIIASHVIEHTPDLVSFLNSCDEVLKDDGVLSLAVPDARFVFDSLRPLTGISKVLDAYANKATVHSIGTAVEQTSEMCTRGGNATWDYKHNKGDFALTHSQEEVERAFQRYSSREYVDYHSWCFTLHSFRLLIHDLNSLGLISLKEISYYCPNSLEFYITLGHGSTSAQVSRLQLLETIREEVCVVTSFSDFFKYKFHRLIAHLRDKRTG